MRVIVKEHSWLAKLAARRLNPDKVARVIGRTIHLYNTTKTDFLQNQKWVKHELTHIRQYQQYGLLRFLYLYLLESYKNGYYNNRFEVEARDSENLETDLSDIVFT